MTLKCKEITAVLGCWTNAGVATPVIIYTEFRENAAGNPVPHATRYTLSDGTPVAASAATVVPGACASAVEFDTLTLCDPATLLPVFIVTRYSPLGVPTSAAFNPDGTPYPGPINGLVSCDTIDLESDALEMCDGGATSFVRWVVKRNGVPTGVSFDTTLGLAPYVPTGVVTVGRCAAAIEPDFSHTITTEPGCAAGVPWTRRTQYDWEETLAGPRLAVVRVDYADSAGASQLTIPFGFTLGSCSELYVPRVVTMRSRNYSGVGIAVDYDPQGFGDTWQSNLDVQGILQSLTVTMLAGSDVPGGGDAVQIITDGESSYLVRGQSVSWSVAQDDGRHAEELDSTDFKVSCFNKSAVLITWTEQR